MADPSALVSEVASAVTDSSPVDWDAIERSASTEDRAVLEELKTIQRHFAAIPRDDDATESPLGTWGELVLLERVGKGAAAEVYRAHDTRLDRPVAVKLFHATALAEHEKARLLEEGKRHAKIKPHPNIVTIFGADEQDGRVGLWMEYIEGQTLDELVRSESHGPFSPAEATLIGLAVCGALREVHRAGYTHGDVKAQNIMRERGGRVVLMDFSTSQRVTEGRPDAGVEGTPLYMAPELILDGASPSFRTDTYSVGVLLFYLVTGAFPVPAATLSALKERHRSGARDTFGDHRNDVPDAYVDVADLALEPDPAKRIASVAAIEKKLAAGQNRTDLWERIANAFEAQAKVVRVAAVVAAYLLGVGVLFTALGFLTSTSLNVALDRPSDYAPESVGQWFVWGLRSLIGPIYHLVTKGVIFAGLYAALVLLGKLLKRKVPRPVAHVSNLVQRMGVDRPQVLARLAAVTGAAVLLALIWRHSEFISAFYAVRDTPVEPSTLAVLSPDNVLYHGGYRADFTLLVTALVIAAVMVKRYARRRGEPTAALGIGGVLVIAIVLLEFPWQILWHANFQRVLAGDEICYDVGKKGEDVLLFCPSSSSKTRVVQADGGQYEWTDIKESPFSIVAASR